MDIRPQDASMGGAGTVGRKADAAIASGQPVITATVTITRAATGAVETYELIGTPIEPQKEQ